MSEEGDKKDRRVMIVGHVDTGKQALFAASILTASQKVNHTVDLLENITDKINPDKLAELKADLDAVMQQEMEKDKREAEAIIELTNPRKDIPETYSPPPTRAERRAADRKKAKKNKKLKK